MKSSDVPTVGIEPPMGSFADVDCLIDNAPGVEVPTSRWHNGSVQRCLSQAMNDPPAGQGARSFCVVCITSLVAFVCIGHLMFSMCKNSTDNGKGYLDSSTA